MSWIDPNFPRTATLTPLVGRVLGLNPGMMTGPGTNTYLVGRRDPILIDTGAGVDDYVPLFARYLARARLDAALARGPDASPSRPPGRRAAAARAVSRACAWPR